MRLGIALYWIDDDGNHSEPYFHWALALTNKDAWDETDITVYQIEGGSPENPEDYRWNFAQRELVRSGTFRGLVEVLAFEGEDGSQYFSQIEAVVRAHPASPSAPSNKVWKQLTGPVGWTCAMWILVVLEDLEQTGMFTMPTGANWKTIYTTILDRGKIALDVFGWTTGPYPVMPLAIC